MASPEGLAVLDRSTGTVDLRVPVERDRPENRANDVKTDDQGQGLGRYDGLRQAATQRRACTGSMAARQPALSTA